MIQTGVADDGPPHGTYDRAGEAGAALQASTDSTAGVTLDVLPIQAEGQRGAFRVAITSELPWPTAVTLAAHARDGELRVRMEPAKPIGVPAHATTYAMLRVAPYKASRPTMEQSYEVEVCALYPAPDGPYLLQATTCAPFLYRPRRATAGWSRRLRWSAIPICLLICGALAYAVVPKASPAKTSNNDPNRPVLRSPGSASPVATSRAATQIPTAGATPRPTSRPAQAHQTRHTNPQGHGSPVPAAHASVTPIFIMTVPTTLRSQPRIDAPRTVLVPKGKHVAAAGAATAHWQYVVFKGKQRGWVVKDHLSLVR